jgi:hypothetical protein
MRSFVDRVPPAYRPLFRGCRLGMVLGFAGLCLVPGLLSRYTIPALPMAAILLGWLLAPRRGLLASDRLWRGILLLLPALLILLAVAASVAMKFGRTSNWLSRLAGEGVVLNLHWTAELVAAMAALAIIGGMLWLIRTRLSSGVDLALVTAVMAAVFVLLSVQVYSSLWPHGEKRRAEAMQINEAVPAGQTLYVFRPSYQRFLIFLRQPVQYLLEPRQMSPQVRYLLLASEPRDEAYLPRVQALQKKLDREYRTTLLCELIQPASKTEKKQVFQLLECQPRSMDIPPATAASQAAEP